MEQGDAFSGTASSYYDHLMTLCRLIDKGDASIGLPPIQRRPVRLRGRAARWKRYACPTRRWLQSSTTSATPGPATARRFVNYRDMSVQQLGSIYERLLEREPARDGERPNRRASQQLCAQGQRQLLHAPGARRTHRGPDPQAPGRRTSPGLRGQVEGVEERPPTQETFAAPSWPVSTLPRRSWT